MDWTLPHILLITLWAVWILQATLSAMQVRKYARRQTRPRRQSFDSYRPPAAVIVPFKGLEPTLADNVRSLCTQHYPAYRLLLVVESEDDPAYPLLQTTAEQYPDRNITLLVADQAAPDVGQKVHNQLVALEHLQQHPADEQVLVFADSDAVPGPNWLGDLVGPLAGDKRGVTTGYRWLIPEAEDGSEPTLWAKLASVMNSSVACFAGQDRFDHAWGGSMALHVNTAREGDLINSLRGCITDDYPFSILARRLGKRVYFVSQCLVASPVNFTLSQLVNFAHRQYLITRTYAPKLYFAGLVLPLIYMLGFVSAWAVLIAAAITAMRAESPQPDSLWPIALAAVVIVTLANHIRASYRRRVVRNAFGDDMVKQLRATLMLDRWATIVWMTFHWLLIARAGIGRTMRWRGIRYEIRGPQNVRRLDDGNNS